MAARAATLRDAGGFAAVAAHAVEDVALVRALAAAGRAVGYLDATDLLTVRMYETAAEAWHGWGRSLALPGVDSRARQLVGLATVALAQALPLVRARRRAVPTRSTSRCWRSAGGTLAGTARAYAERGAAYWLSPLADVLAVAALVRSTVATPRAWRGRGPACRAIQNRRPTSDMSAPVAAVRRGPSTTSWATGKHRVADLDAARRRRVVAARRPRRRRPPRAAAAGATTPAAPPSVATLRPPRKPANSGQAWPTIAAAPPT